MRACNIILLEIRSDEIFLFPVIRTGANDQALSGHTAKTVLSASDFQKEEAAEFF